MLSWLTEDLLERILDKLTSDSDRKTWRLVCTEFYRVELAHRKTIRIFRSEYISILLNKYSNIDQLDLSVCPRIDNGTVSSILNRNSRIWTRRLKGIVLSRTSGLRSGGLEMLVKACPCLEFVDMSYCLGFGDREASVLSCAYGLRDLRLDRCLNLTDVGLAKIVIGCCKLEKLSLKWCMEITDLGIDFLVKKCFDLKSLDVSYLKVTSQSLQSIASLTKLEVLIMTGCSLVDDIGLAFLENGCPSLQEINVLRCSGITVPGLISVIKGHNGLLHIHAGYCLSELSMPLIHKFTDLKSLKSIKTDGAQVSDFYFQTISSNCKNLIEIGLSKCIGVTDTGIIQLVSKCVNLTVLDLTCCNSITDKAISAIAESCKNLVCLKLEACNLITEKSLDRIGSCCLRLEEIDLTDCCGVDDTGLGYLAKCSELTIVKLGLCTNVSDQGLTYIASKCLKILELDLYRCTGIGDDGLGALSVGCKKVRKLNVSYCDKISDNGMDHIALLEELRDLEMRSLTNVTSVGLSAVAAGCKKLTELDLKLCENIDDTGFCSLAYYSWNLRQINLSNCDVSDVGLRMMLGSLPCLQDAKLVDLRNVSIEGIEIALKACCVRLKKLKLLATLRSYISKEIIWTLKANGCNIRWD